MKGDRDGEYHFYAILALIFALAYFAATLLIFFVPEDILTVSVRDILSGAFLVGVVFGMPIVMLVGIIAMIYARLEHKRGRLFGIFAIIAPIIFLVALKFHWRPAGGEFLQFGNPEAHTQELP